MCPAVFHMCSGSPMHRQYLPENAPSGGCGPQRVPSVWLTSRDSAKAVEFGSAIRSRLHSGMKRAPAQQRLSPQETKTPRFSEPYAGGADVSRHCFAGQQQRGTSGGGTPAFTRIVVLFRDGCGSCVLNDRVHLASGQDGQPGDVEPEQQYHNSAEQAVRGAVAV